jgi:hypothetical protein
MLSSKILTSDNAPLVTLSAFLSNIRHPLFLMMKEVSQSLAGRIGDLLSFEKFLRSCAARTGQELNISNITQECGISATTATRWLSVLESTFIVKLISPYFGALFETMVYANFFKKRSADGDVPPHYYLYTHLSLVFKCSKRGGVSEASYWTLGRV